VHDPQPESDQHERHQATADPTNRRAKRAMAYQPVRERDPDCRHHREHHADDQDLRQRARGEQWDVDAQVVAAVGDRDRGYRCDSRRATVDLFGVRGGAMAGLDQVLRP